MIPLHAVVSAAALQAATASGAPAPAFEDALRALAGRHGIDIVWDGGPYEERWEGGGRSAHDAASWELELYAPLLVEELDLYPRDFLRSAGVRTIVLVRDLLSDEEGVEQHVEGGLDVPRATLFLGVDFTHKTNTRAKQRRVVHHVVFHQVDVTMGPGDDDPDWLALNRDGFSYGDHGAGGQHDRRSTTGLLTDDYPGFLNLYSAGHIADDKAGLFAYLMVVHPYVAGRARADSVLDAKVRTLKARLAAFHPRIDSAFWARMAGRALEVAPYTARSEPPWRPFDFRAALAELSDRHGVEIVWQGGPWERTYEWGRRAARDPADWEVELYAPVLLEELSLYPPSFLEQWDVERIVLVRDLWVEQEGVYQNLAGQIFDNRELLLNVGFTYKVNHRDKQRRYLHHLLWHHYDVLWGTLWEDPEWEALNEPGFEYGVLTKGGIHDRSPATGLLSDAHPGFLNRYATGTLPDDKADTFAYLMVAYGYVMERAAADPVLRAKVETLKKRLAAADPAFDDAFWSRIAAIARDPAVYRVE